MRFVQARNEKCEFGAISADSSKTEHFADFSG
jgi:hypothetical protein